MPKNHAIDASRIAPEPPVTIIGPTLDLQIYSSIVGAGEIIGRSHDHLEASSPPAVVTIWYRSRILCNHLRPP
ncbi:hypothetical protein TIFTF001_055091 [Ficus carica]|uniref:Uncharacterized protein n=1 Tax=Ficus carica TaxID=3494 RepID=A0AA88JG85_FICCA|nr:hypothetical protein TIFTF001_055091 [Ficus carica]